MKQLSIVFSATLFLLSNFTGKAQLSVTGTDGLFITAANTVSTDGLVLQPSVDLSLSDITITRSNTAVTSTGGNSISRVYIFSQPFSITGTLITPYQISELNGNTEPDLAFVYKRSSDNIYVTSSNSTLDQLNDNISQVMSGVISISQVTAVNSDVVLPVSLGNYTAKAEGNRTKVEWNTVYEQNNDHFEVERSIDGNTYSTIGVVRGTNAEHGSAYFTYDYSPVEGINYYRLVQYDKDGHKKYYGVQTVSFNASNQVAVMAYPNPAIKTLGISLQNYTGQKISIALFDLHGTLIHKEEILTQPGEKVYPVNLKSMPASGNYILKVTGTQGLNRSMKVTVL